MSKDGVWPTHTQILARPGCYSVASRAARLRIFHKYVPEWRKLAATGRGFW
jgi:hypothetical protein